MPVGKRRRIKSSEKEDSIEIKSLTDINETSSWNVDTVKSLNITIIDILDINVMFGPNVSLDSYNEPLILPEWNTDSDICQITNDNKIRTLFEKAKEIKLSEEIYINGFVNSLLNITGFDDYPCRLYLQYAYKAYFVNEHCISSNADFAVLSSNKNKMLLVIEDKIASNATYANNWKEPQVIGKIFVAIHKIIASNNSISLPIELYAIRVVGTKFTFYKCNATEDHIKESASRLPKKSNMIIQRFPPQKINATSLIALDFCSLKDRNIILKSISSIRKKIIC